MEREHRSIREVDNKDRQGVSGAASGQEKRKRTGGVQGQSEGRYPLKV